MRNHVSKELVTKTKTSGQVVYYLVRHSAPIFRLKSTHHTAVDGIPFLASTRTTSYLGFFAHKLMIKIEKFNIY